MKLPSLKSARASRLPGSHTRNFLLLAFLLASAAISPAQVPGIITYQGRVTSNGNSFTGTGQFRFAIYRNGPPASLWSHDGTSVGGAIPQTALSLPVANGLFSVGLGDITVPGMLVPVSPNIFASSGLRLRIWFSDGVRAPAVIADHTLTSAGYAMFAAGVPDGSITSTKIAGGAVGSAQLADDITLSDLRLNEIGTETVTLDASTGPGQGALFTLRNGLGSPTFVLDSDTVGERGSSVSLLNTSGITTIALNSDGIGESGSLSLRTSTNLETVQLLASIGGGEGALLHLRNGSFRTTLTLDADDAGHAGSLAIFNKDGNQTALIDGDQGNGIGGVIQLFNDAGAIRAELDGQGASGGGELVLRDANGTSTVNFRAAEAAATGARLDLHQADGTRTVVLDAQGGTGGGFFELYKADGTRTVWIDADAAGEGKVTTQVLEITGGSDFSENFDIQSPGAQPGMLVKIDPANPGELSVSDRAYDRTVAGVVSGAGGVKPGLMMGQRGTAADGKHPVALTGRVYCLADAEHGAIEPGDLITTSNTPGHGMKVADHTLAQGAVIGKAMTGLASGRGLVLVLVSLQ